MPGEFTSLHTYSLELYIYTSAAARLRAALSLGRKCEVSIKYQRHNAIRDLVGSSPVTNQDELRRKLRRRGFEVTQATLSRDIHELHISKGPGGYSLPQGNGNGTGSMGANDGPSVAEVLESFGLRVRKPVNQAVIRTVTRGAQPVAASIDYEDWAEVVGTIAGDDTVLIICQDVRHATDVESRVRTMLES